MLLPDAGADLLDERDFGRGTRLQKGARGEPDSHTRQQHTDRTALHDEDVLAARLPDDPGEIALLGELYQRFECRELRPHCRLDQHIDAAVGACQHSLCRAARRQ